jgi:membrane associated rhomboid family serine protease
MAGGPDLFVVCKHCQAEVSPYITECPYCGRRLRKRAPKLDKGGVPKAPKPPRRPKRPSLSTRRFGSDEPADPESGHGRPYGPLFLVVAAVLVSLAVRTTLIDVLDLVVGPEDDIGMRALLAPFVYLSTAYQVVALGSIFLFGWLLHRRHGPAVPLLVFFAAAVGGMLVVATVDPNTWASGGNGAALGLLAAWAMRDLLARRRGEEVDWDGLGVLVLAVVLVMLPAAVEEAHALAGAAGGLIGVAFGLVLARLSRR